MEDTIIGVMKLDSFGNIVWQNSIGGNLADELTSISPNIDGGLRCEKFRIRYFF
ncbi:MAG: hypothetical protein IPK08_23860 [Bacteroidetes bacterium]|nr:hypothetical protein [Bacteroidota bacterium]